MSISLKQRLCLWRAKKRDKPCIIYNNEPLECVESFKYLVLEVPSNHRWKTSILCICWVLKKYIFDTLVTPVLLYGLEVWSGSIPKSTWERVWKCPKTFESYKVSTSEETNALHPPPWDGITSHWDHGYGKGCSITCLRLKNGPHIDFLALHGKQAKRSKRRIKAKFCVPVGCKIWKMVW